jgi:hypothetical protein
MPFSLFPKKRK